MLQGWQIIDIYVLFVWNQYLIENQWSFNRLEFPYVFSEWDFQWNYDVVWCCVHIIMGKKGATYEFLQNLFNQDVSMLSGTSENTAFWKKIILNPFNLVWITSYIGAGLLFGLLHQVIIECKAGFIRAFQIIICLEC